MTCILCFTGIQDGLLKTKIIITRRNLLSTGIERSYCFFLFSVDTISIDCPWLVLDQKDNQFLLISALGIDSRKYHNDSMYVTWRMYNKQR